MFVMATASVTDDASSASAAYERLGTRRRGRRPIPNPDPLPGIPSSAIDGQHDPALGGSVERWWHIDAGDVDGSENWRAWVEPVLTGRVRRNEPALLQRAGGRRSDARQLPPNRPLVVVVWQA